jgi:UDP-N-acetylglucosamine 2-epimerase (non-hydrolysing)
MKVFTLVGTRPELIKLSETIKELDRSLEHILVHTGQNFDYELNEVFFEQLGIRKPDYFLNAAGDNPTETIANVITKTDKLLEEIKPDAFLIYGDTNSCLGVIAAKKRRIPIFHMEAGNRCFDQRVPEEINRKIIDHLSDINMVLSEHARRYLIAEGVKAETIIKTGSSMLEVLNNHKLAIDNCNILEQEKLESGSYIIVSAHREENIDSPENFQALLDTLEALQIHFQKTIIVSTHPRIRNKLESTNFANQNNKIQFMKPFGFFEYIKLQKESFCVVSDSGTITEEASILKIPAVTIRQAHERPEGMDEGILIMAGLNPANVIKAIEVTRNHFQDIIPFEEVEDYAVESVSKKVVKIILSYTGYINRTVWRKNEL